MDLIVLHVTLNAVDEMVQTTNNKIMKSKQKKQFIMSKLKVLKVEEKKSSKLTPETLKDNPEVLSRIKELINYSGNKHLGVGGTDISCGALQMSGINSAYGESRRIVSFLKGTRDNPSLKYSSATLIPNMISELKGVLYNKEFIEEKLIKWVFQNMILDRILTKCPAFTLVSTNMTSGGQSTKNEPIGVTNEWAILDGCLTEMCETCTEPAYNNNSRNFIKIWIFNRETVADKLT